MQHRNYVVYFLCDHQPRLKPDGTVARSTTFWCDVGRRYLLELVWPNQFGVDLIEGIAQLSDTMIRDGGPDGDVHLVRRYEYQPESVDPFHPARVIGHYCGTYQTLHKLARWYDCPKVDHHAWMPQLRRQPNIGDVKEMEKWVRTWSKDEMRMDWVASWYDEPGRDAADNPLLMPIGHLRPEGRRGQRYYFVDLLHQGAAVTFALCWRGMGGELSQMIRWRHFH